MQLIDKNVNSGKLPRIILKKVQKEGIILLVNAFTKIRGKGRGIYAKDY